MNKVNHVAFIMDGNGRWGKKKNRGRNYGHLKGVETVKKIVKSSLKLKIPIVTFYVFSSENWKRPKKEISYLFKLIKNYFSQEIESIINQGIKINILGELNKLSSDIKLALRRTTKLTQKNNKIIVNLAINYGSKNEILSASKKTKSKLNIKKFEENLYTKNMPDPDILIRTGGHQRLSNFLLWQLAYAELFFLEKLWPDFNSIDLKKIINKYKKSKRNFGNI
jgi:undecaprenyl diphosphate synthase|tara:strand:- start:708 stop:1376 length:669 start_codon:yes stop_codon:yes gene_type:complete